MLSQYNKRRAGFDYFILDWSRGGLHLSRRPRRHRIMGRPGKKLADEFDYDRIY